MLDARLELVKIIPGVRQAAVKVTSGLALPIHGDLSYAAQDVNALRSGAHDRHRAKWA